MEGLFESAVTLGLTILILGLGGILLLAGRSYLWLLLGAGGLIIVLAITAEIQGYADLWEIVQERLWIFLLIAFAAAAAGVFIGKAHRSLAIDILGFAAGVLVASWFDEIILSLSGNAADVFAWWLIPIFIVAGVIGVWLTRKDPEEALILISVLIGASTIGSGLNLDPDRNITAVIILGLTLTGVVVQYASYLREQPRLGAPLPPVPHPVSEELPFE